MKKGSFGRLAIILGGLLLSLQMYGLKFIQLFEVQTGEWLTDAINYAKETPILISLFITLAVIIYGVILIIKYDKSKEWVTVSVCLKCNYDKQHKTAITIVTTRIE